MSTVQRDRARITDVTDGDTVRVRFPGGYEESVRLLGIDTPEVFGGRVQCGAEKASRSAERMLPVGTRVLLVSDASQDLEDRYGRLLRYVIKGGTDISKAQVRRGMAKVYVYNRNPFDRTKTYRSAESSAKSSNRGNWKACW